MPDDEDGSWQGSDASSANEEDDEAAAGDLYGGDGAALLAGARGRDRAMSLAPLHGQMVTHASRPYAEPARWVFGCLKNNELFAVISHQTAAKYGKVSGVRTRPCFLISYALQAWAYTCPGSCLVPLSAVMLSLVAGLARRCTPHTRLNM
jgi:hypothetical protein